MRDPGVLGQRLIALDAREVLDHHLLAVVYRTGRDRLDGPADLLVEPDLVLTVGRHQHLEAIEAGVVCPFPGLLAPLDLGGDVPVERVLKERRADAFEVRFVRVLLRHVLVVPRGLDGVLRSGPPVRPARCVSSATYIRSTRRRRYRWLTSISDT